MRGIGPLTPAAPQKAQLTQPLQEQLKDVFLLAVRDQAGAKAAEHREVEPRIGQLQAQRVLPLDPAPHRVGGLPIGQVLGVLQHRYQRQLPGRQAGAPTRPEHARELGIGEQRAQRVADAHRHRAFGEGGPCHPRGQLGDLRPWTRPHRHRSTILSPPEEGKAERQTILIQGISRFREATTN
ncbi:hypothetical protein GCM10014719_71680 [Planomonospora parontospora subsp. antibiotica]|nr:hypothetical protein [Planomonospora parontospora]GGL60238.1 hypothetical protein GCM10014719_71680 [Planomonospora parontospora subsp. antibiotica]GII20390.1 hypothetical protein Ppa05_71160 [Planomonospora parontospora subsp. antibiotica]